MIDKSKSYKFSDYTIYLVPYYQIKNKRYPREFNSLGYKAMGYADEIIYYLDYIYKKFVYINGDYYYKYRYKNFVAFVEFTFYVNNQLVYILEYAKYLKSYYKKINKRIRNLINEIDH